MDDLRLLAAEAATLFTLDAAGCLLRVNEPDGGPAPRFLWGATAAGARWWRRADLPVEVAEIASRLLASAAIDPLAPLSPRVVGAVSRLLARYQPVTAVRQGPSYLCPNTLLASGVAVLLSPADAAVAARYLPEWEAGIPWRQPCAAVLVGGDAVAICAVARRGVEAMEAGVETHPDWRRRGFAAHATALWATAVRAEGRLPLYSTSWDNTASRSVAARLGLRPIANLLHLG